MRVARALETDNGAGIDPANIGNAVTEGSDLSTAFAKLVERFEAMGNGAIASLPNLLIALIILAVFVVLGRVSNRSVVRILLRLGQSQNVGRVFGRLARWTVVVCGALIAATVIFPSLNARSIVSAFGISSVAIGFAFKDIFQNMLAGLLILVTRPFRIGDQIVSGPHEGTVEDVQIRATLLRTYDNRRIVIPNSELYTGRVVVNTAHPQRRLTTDVCVGYDGDIDEAKRLILERIKSVPEILQNPEPSVLSKGLVSSGVVLAVRVWVSPTLRSEIVMVRNNLVDTVRRCLLENGYSIAPSTSEITVRRVGEPEPKSQEPGSTVAPA